MMSSSLASHMCATPEDPDGRGAPTPLPSPGGFVPRVRSSDGDRWGPVLAAGRLPLRRPVRVQGRVTSTASVAHPDGRSWEAVVADQSGEVVIVFLGRSEVPGIVPGTVLEACGTARSLAGRIEILNPLYELISAPTSRSDT